ncbi:MAG: NUDIX domain-containing protein [Tepidibacter sp.]|jgi:8-oxo-dGTP diphosphatase|uniref:NUDIX hydrolase n=1 Tax=Tepidibacter sp. TaxID=2529387 RepID=UPI0025F00179|nr:NUDIX domain-containing protein [Tepidibacter sp.]MCT4509943.1 NUDIX domain-containing protein [Tepidibacter sp.]
MIKVDFYEIGNIEDKKLEFAVIVAEFKNEYIFVKHKDRDTWELPGGHREVDESIDKAGERELFEETGVRTYSIEGVYDYSVTIDSNTRFGRLFYAKIEKLDELPEFEIKEIGFFKDIPDNLTYAKIQPELYKKVLKYF